MADVTFVGEDLRGYAQKYHDSGDGTYARVIFVAGSVAAGTDKIIYGQDYRTLPRKLHDSGDGTFALVRAGG